MKIKGKPTDFARKAMQEFNDKAYHSPQDEMQARLGLLGLRRAGPVRPRRGPRRRQRRPPADLEPRRRIPPGAGEERREVVLSGLLASTVESENAPLAITWNIHIVFLAEAGAICLPH